MKRPRGAFGAGALMVMLLTAGLAGWVGAMQAQERRQVEVKDSGAGAQACTGAQEVRQARRVVRRDDQVLEDRIVALPDTLPLQWRSERVALHYVIDVSACAGSSSAALSLFRVGAPYVASALGVPLDSLVARNGNAPTGASAGSATTLRAAPIFNGRIPNLFALPKDAQTIDIRLLTLPYIPIGLAMATLGPTNALLPMAVQDVNRVIRYTDAAAGVMLVLALMGGVLWLQRRHDMGFLWMTLACVCWSVRALAYFDRNIYLPPIWFEQLNPFNILLTAVALCAATLASMLRPVANSVSTVPVDWRRRARQALGVAVASSAAALALSVWLDGGAMLARAYTQSWALGLSIATIWWIWSGRIRLARLHRFTTISAYLGLIAAAAHDMALVTGSIAPTGPSYLFWGFTVVLVVYALISGDYIITTLNRAENSNLELELRFNRKSAELEHSYQQLRKTEMAGALSSARLHERERLLRDMHDGLGAQLMTALRGVERSALSRNQIAQSLQDGMDELRMLMDSADMGSDLSSALAAWRNRWDTRLGAAGVQLHWHLDDSIDGLQLDSDALLQIMRILQEAATNVVKHAKARNLHVQARLLRQNEETWLVIVARDDGCGLLHEKTPGRSPVFLHPLGGAGEAKAGGDLQKTPGRSQVFLHPLGGPGEARAGGTQQHPPRSQRGLRNMAHRATQIGARLDVSNGNEPLLGCQVLLELRIDPPTARPERRRHARPLPLAGANPATLS